MEGPILGGYMELKEETMSSDGRRRRPALPHLVEPDLNRVYYYSIMPNCFLSLHPDYVMVHTLHPRAPDRTHITCQWLFHPDALDSDSFDPSDVISFWDETNRQDWHVCELAQRGVSSLAYQPGPYSNAEGLLWAFDRYYLGLLDEPDLSSVRLQK
jgi:Rieske 2Fe-2S family protein